VICQTWGDTEPGYFDRLVPLLGTDQPVVAICRPDVLTTRLNSTDDWVAFELEQLAGLPLAGPYRIAGWSFGGIVALELARALITRGEGEQVASIELLDSWIPRREYRGRFGQATEAVRKILGHLEHMERRSREQRVAYMRALVSRIAGRRGEAAGRLGRGVVARMRGEPRAPTSESAAPKALSPEIRSIWVPWLKYEPQPFPRPVVVYPCTRSIRHHDGDASLGFGAWLPRGFTVHEIPGGHETMWEHPNLDVLAAALTPR
jgi:acetoacetyl-CoA synthetase